MLLESIEIDYTLDAVGLACGDLVMAVFHKMKQVSGGQILEVIAYDLGALEDIPSWCKMQGHTLLHVEETGLLATHFIIKKQK